jgi:hypothetical protein
MQVQQLNNHQHHSLQAIKQQPNKAPIIKQQLNNNNNQLSQNQLITALQIH